MRTKGFGVMLRFLAIETHLEEREFFEKWK